MTKPSASPHVRTKRLVDDLRLGGTGQGLNAHRLIAETAVEMANEFFEVYARQNDIYRKLRANGQVTEKQARRYFVQRVAPTLLEDARKNLAECLNQPDDRVTPAMKEEVYEALRLDNDLRANRFVAEDQATVPMRLH